MKYLEDLRDKHKGEEIWVVGAGPSLDEYPIDFFKDKICIGVNWVFSVFLDIGDGIEKLSTQTFYSVHSHRPAVDCIVSHIPHFLTNCFIVAVPPNLRVINGRTYCCPQDFKEGPYWIRNAWQAGNTRASDATFRALAKCIMAKRDDCSYFCRGTTLHWAIEVAAVLGAKKIYVVGGEARMSGKARHMYKHGSLYVEGDRRPRRDFGFIRIFYEGTRALAAAFEPYGIEIVYYYYDKGEQGL